MTKSQVSKTIQPMKSYARLVLMLALSSILSGQASTPGAAVGKAIGDGVKAFVGAAFPGGDALLGTLDKWLVGRLSLKPEQKQAIKSNADSEKAQADKGQAKPTEATKATAVKIQAAADNLKIASVILYHTNNASRELIIFQTLLTALPADGKITAKISSHWNNAAGELGLIKTELKDAMTKLTDTGVSLALEGLQSAMAGPMTTINKNDNPNGDMTVLREASQKLLDSVSDFDKLGVVLPGQVAAELSAAMADITKQGGGSKLDDLTRNAVNNSIAALPKPVAVPIGKR